MKKTALIITLLGAICFAYGTSICLAQPKVPLGALPADTPDEVKEAVKQLYSTDYKTQLAAIKELGKMGQEAAPAVPFLVSMMADRRYSTAGRALSRIGGASFDPLLKALKHKDVRMRQMAASALGGLDDSRAVEPLIESLKDPEIMTRAANALARYRSDPRTTDLLIAGLNDKDVGRRRGAAYALQRVGDRRSADALIKGLKDKDAQVRAAIAAALGAMRATEAAGPMISLLKDKDETVRTEAAKALSKMKDTSAVEPLIEVLRKDPAPAVRKTAAETLGQLNDPRAVEPLVTAIEKDPDQAVKQQAARQAAKFRSPHVFDLLVPLLKSRDSDVRECAASTLVKLKNPRSLEYFVALLRDKEYSVRVQAARGLASLGDARAVEPLVKALRDEELLRETTSALARLRDPRAVDPLIGMLGRAEGTQQRTIQSALNRITGQNLGTEAARWRKWWKENKRLYGLKK